MVSRILRFPVSGRKFEFVGPPSKVARTSKSFPESTLKSPSQQLRNQAMPIMKLFGKR